jgi:hypothetical protein
VRLFTAGITPSATVTALPPAGIEPSGKREDRLHRSSYRHVLATGKGARRRLIRLKVKMTRTNAGYSIFFFEEGWGGFFGNRRRRATAVTALI